LCFSAVGYYFACWTTEISSNINKKEQRSINDSAMFLCYIHSDRHILSVDWHIERDIAEFCDVPLDMPRHTPKNERVLKK